MSVTLQDIFRARRRITGRLVRTPLVESHWLSSAGGPQRSSSTEDKAHVYLKLESLQATGSFKLRGALNAALAWLEVQEAPVGHQGPLLVTASAGNHGLALAYAADELGLRVTVFTPREAARVKLEAIGRHQPDLRPEADGYEDAERLAKEFVRSTGARYISPYDNPDVIAGAGTIGVEILEDLPEVDSIVVPVGGGGLISGIATAARAIAPHVEIVGVEAAASPAFHTSLKAGRIVQVGVQPTIADGLAGNMDPGTITFDIVRRLVDRVELVTEEELKAAIRDLIAHEHLVAEGAGIVGVAAALAGKIQVAGRRTVIVVSGANIDLERLRQALDR